MSVVTPVVVDLAATAVALITLVTLHLLPTGLSPVSDPVSQYGITSFRLGYRVLTVSLGVAGLSAAVAVAADHGFPAAGHTEIVALLVILGVCRLVISWAPMDAPGRPRSTHGTVHVALAIGAFVAAAAAANVLHRTVGDLASPAGGYRGALQGAFWLIVIGLAGQVLLRRATPGHTGYGAAERLVYVGIFVLLAATGLALL